METITAFENVCRDLFSVAAVWPVLKGFGSWLGAIAPFVAIVWAVYAYFHKLQAEREAEAKVERRKVYRDYLAALQAASRQTDFKFVRDYGLAVANELMDHHQLLSLIAPNEVATASLELLQAFLGTDQQFYDDDGQPILSMVELIKRGRGGSRRDFELQVKANQPIRDARTRLLNSMRADLLNGTSIDRILTSVEELRGE